MLAGADLLGSGEILVELEPADMDDFLTKPLRQAELGAVESSGIRATAAYCGGMRVV